MQREDEIVGSKTLVSAVMNAGTSFQMFVYQAGRLGPHQAKSILSRNNIFFNTLLGNALWFFRVGCAGGEAGVFSAPLSSWRLSRSEVSTGNMESCGECTCQHEISKGCTLLSDLDFTRQLGKHFFHFSFTQSESICQCGSTVQEKDLINSGI